MKKLILLSDIHLTFDTPQARLDNIVETQFKKLEYVYQYAKSNDAVICQAGDYVDKPRSWYLLPLLTKFLLKWHVNGVETFMVRGQHDYYYYSEAAGAATVIGALAEAGFLTILDGDKPITMDFDGESVRLYGASFGQSVPVPTKYHNGNILLTHREISDQALFDGHKYYSPRGFLKRHQNYKLILCADIHRRFKSSLKSSNNDRLRHIVNTGPMLRTSATHYNFEHKPGFYIWEPATQKLAWKEIPHIKADEVLTRAHIESTEAEDKLMAEFTRKLMSKKGTDTETMGTGNYRSAVDAFVQEHQVSKDIAGHIYGALQEIDVDEL